MDSFKTTKKARSKKARSVPHTWDGGREGIPIAAEKGTPRRMAVGISLPQYDESIKRVRLF